MQARHITTRHAIKSYGNVAKVRQWHLLTEITFESGETITVFPTRTLKVVPRRTADGKFEPKTWLVVMWSHFTGDEVKMVETRRMARGTAKLHKLLNGGTTQIIAL